MGGGAALMVPLKFSVVTEKTVSIFLLRDRIELLTFVITTLNVIYKVIFICGQSKNQCADYTSKLNSFFKSILG